MLGLFGSLARGGEGKSLPAGSGTQYGPAEEMWAGLFGAAPSSTGISVTWKRALEVTTALRCAAIIAEGICSVPFKLYRKETGPDGRARRAEQIDHPLTDLFYTGPNDWQTGFEFRETIGLHLALCGNAYVFVNRVRGQVVEMIPFEPGSVAVEQAPDWSLSYRVTAPNREQQTFPAGTIWHLRGRSWNSWTGLEAIHLAREALGLALATEISHGRMHDNAARPAGILSVEGSLTEDQFRFYRKWIDANYRGVGRTGRTLITDRAAKWQSQQMTGVDAQHLQTRGYQVEEICRAFGVLPIMVGYTGDKSATYASAEQMFLAHATHTVRPWHRRIEPSASKWLLTPQERNKGLYFGFVDTELLRGDAKTRAEYYKMGINDGWLVRNDARGFEDMEPIDGLDVPLMPLNAAVVGKDGMPVLPTKAGNPTNPGAPEPTE